MNVEQITQAFHDRLRAWPNLGDVDVSWLGVPFEPRDGRTYLSPRMSSYASQVVGAGRDGLEQHDGTYSVSVRGPADDGTAVVGGYAGELRRWFARGTTILDPVIVVSSSEGTPAPMGDRIQAQVTVTWTALAPQG